MPEKIWPDINSQLLTSPEHQFRMLLYEMALKHDISIGAIKGRSKKGHIVKARNEFVCKAVELGFTRQKIGDYLDERKPSTITDLYHNHKHRFL